MEDPVPRSEITLKISGETDSPSQSHPVTRYQIGDDSVSDVAFSSVSPEVLYISTLDTQLYSFNITSLTLTSTSLDDSGYYDGYGTIHAKLIRRLLCYKTFLYTLRSEFGNLCINKFSIETESSLKRVGGCAYSETDAYRWRPAASSHDGVLYCALCTSILVVDGDTLTELARIEPLVFGPLRGVFIVDVAVSGDGQLLIATGDAAAPFTVYTCDRDGRTNQLYCDEHVVPMKPTQSERRFIACTSHGHVMAATETKLAVLSAGDQHKLIQSVSSSGVHCITAMKCSPLQNTIAMIHYSPGLDEDGYATNIFSLLILPLSAYLPSFQPPSSGQHKINSTASVGAEPIADPNVPVAIGEVA